MRPSRARLPARLWALLAAALLLGCGEKPAPEAAEAPPPQPSTSGALAPSTAASEALGASRADRVRQALTDLRAARTPEGLVITLPEDILFDFDKADIRPDARETLARLAEVIDYYADAPVRIDGHTDNKGTDAYNLDLSQRRAEAVANYLAANSGVAPARMQTRGLGEQQPVAANALPDGSDNPEGRRRNRRVEVVLVGAADLPPDSSAGK